VGDIVRVKGGEDVPADLFLLSTSNSTGICSIETSNLDGETNLKVVCTPGGVFSILLIFYFYFIFIL